jgi:hypothetical protein
MKKKFQPNGTKHKEVRDCYAPSCGGSVRVDCPRPHMRLVAAGPGKSKRTHVR